MKEPATECEVISTSKGVHSGKAGNAIEEDVIAYDEEEGGERTTLFDAPHDIDPTILREGRSDLDIVKKGANKGGEPLGETRSDDSLMDK